MLLTLVAGATAEPPINKEISQLEKKIDADLASGALTKPDGDELKLEVNEVKRVESSEPSLTLATRRDLRQKLSKLRKDLDLKENQEKALGAASPAASP